MFNSNELQYVFIDVLFLIWFKNTVLVTVSLLKYGVKIAYK
jgi:hypothetical protein